MRRLALFALLLLPLAACVPQTKARMLTGSLPATGISALSMNVNIGAITIKPSSDANVHIKVALRPAKRSIWALFTGSREPAAMRNATLGDSVDKGILNLKLDFPDHKGSEDVSEDWVVELPATVQIGTRLNIGKLQVTGMTGGVDGKLNIGKATLDVPGGPLNVRVNIGKITARAHTTMYGKVHLGADIGDTRLKVNGLTVGDRQHEGTGSQMHYQGKGTDGINLSVNTGKVALSLVDQRPRIPSAGK